MNIGERIKELRRKNDLTQEKLADYLNVSPQAVSKWECGASSPDLGLIGPLTKLLHVSADELLGLTAEEMDGRKKELEDAFEETWKTGNLKDRYDVCVAAIAEYPGDMKWLNDLAWVEAMRSFEYEDKEVSNAEQDKAIKKFARVIEECEDPKIRNHAISGIVQYLMARGRSDEAKKYAEIYPEDDKEGRRWVLGLVLKGDEKLLFEQENVERKLNEFIRAVYWNFIMCHNPSDIPLASDVILKTLKTVFPDGNYLLYNDAIAEAYYEKAAMFATEGKYDEAMEKLKKSFYHAKEYDKIDSVKNTEIRHYTTPLFDRLTVKPSEYFRSEDDTLADSFRQRLKVKEVFTPLRSREDFKALIGE